MLKVVIKQDASWTRLDYRESSLWFKGYLYNKSVNDLLNELPDLKSAFIAEYLLGLNGHFAFVFQNAQSTLVAVDRVRSIPVFYNEHEFCSNTTFLTKKTSYKADNVIF